MSLAQSFPAVGQMQAHGRAGGIGILTGDGVVDFLVLATQAIHVVLLIVMGQSRRVIGDAPEEPEWQGLSKPTGTWDDALDDMVGLTGIELSIPRFELEKYLNSTVELRYKFADEASLEPSFEPLKLYVEA
jgi:hypothetical protein